MASQGTYCELALVEDFVKFLTEKGAMEDDSVLYTIMVYDVLESLMVFIILIPVVWSNSSDYMEIDIARIRSILVVLTNTPDQSVIPMP